MATRTYDQWKNFFHAEGEAHVGFLQNFGYHVTDPYSAASTYASFAAFDAIKLGKTEIDMNRARDMAARMAGVSVEQSDRIAA